MEASPSSIVKSAAAEAAGTAEPETKGGSARRRLFGRRSAPDSFHANLDADARLRLRLQRRSRRNLRRQLVRAVVRVSVLIIADLGAFAVMRALLRSVRDYLLFGPGIGAVVAAVLPRGALSGWQFGVALLIGLVVTGNYGPGDMRRGPLRLFLASALAVSLPLWVEIWQRGLPLVLVEYVLSTMLVWVGLLAERFTIDRIVAVVRSPERDAPRTLFVGPSSACRRACASPLFRSGNHYRVLGFVDTDRPTAPDALGATDELGRLVHEQEAEAVVVCGHYGDSEFQHVVDTALSAGCELLSVPRTSRIAGVRPSFVWREGEVLVALIAPALKGQQLVLKRAVDVLAGVVGLVMTAPIMALVAVAIKLDSQGPVFFSQERVGFGGRRFRIHKFRTMDLDAERRLEEMRTHSLYDDPRLFKVVADPRVTKVGRWLRKTSLDELPQFWNVVKGEMSLVGPRPPLPMEVALYESHHYARFDVKPGITGPWQANGRNEITDFEQVVRLETAYIREWSIWKDVQLLARTVPVVLKMQGAH